MTPPGSPCSIHFGKKVTTAAPGSIKNLYLVVSDIEAARRDLAGRGADVSVADQGGHAVVLGRRSPSMYPSTLPWEEDRGETLSDLRHASVDEELGARHIAAVVGREEHHGLGDLVRRAHASQRHGAYHA